MSNDGQFSIVDFLEFSGSIGRAQFLFNFSVLAVGQFLVSLGMGLFNLTLHSTEALLIAKMIYYGGSLAFFFSSLFFHLTNFLKRARDIHQDEFRCRVLAASTLIPFVNLIVIIYLFVAPGRLVRNEEKS